MADKPYTVVGELNGDVEYFHAWGENSQEAIEDCCRTMDEDHHDEYPDDEDKPSEEFSVAFVFEGHLESV